jgi:hypothetical protein
MHRRSVQFALALLVACAAFAAEFPVSDIVLGDPPAGGGGHTVASDGDGFLATWFDARSVDPQLFAARITRGGLVLDPTGIVLARGVNARPQVLWNGQRYLVFWEVDGTLAVVEVNRDGTVSGPRTVLQNVSFGSYRGASIVTNGSRIVMVYGDRAGFSGAPDKLRVGVFTLDATLIRESIVQQADPANQYAMTRLLPSIAVNGGQFAVAWNIFRTDEQLELRAVRLATDGALLDAQPRVLGAAGLAATIVANGSGYVALSSFAAWGVSGDLSTSTAPAELAVAISDPAVVIQRGGRATVFGLQQDENSAGVLTAGEFDDQGRVAAALPLSVPSRGALAAASNGTDLLLLCLRDTSVLEAATPPVMAAILDASTLQRKTNLVPFTLSASRQSAPAIAASDSGLLAAWQEAGEIYAGRLLANGTRLDGRGVLLSSGERDGFPSVVFDGQRYVIAFTHYKGFRDAEVVVRFVSPQSGLLSNEIRIPAAEAGFGLSLAKGSDAVLLVWKDDLRLLAARINSAMQLIDTPLEIAANDPVSPVAAWNGSQYLVAWRSTRFDFDFISYPSILGARLTPGLTRIDTEPLVLALVDDREHLEPSLAWNGSSWLLAFATHRLFAEGPEEVRLVRLDANANPGPASIVGNGFAPQLIAAGSRTWLAWKEDTAERALRVVPVTSAGTVDPSVVQRFAAQTPLGFEWQERFGLAAKGSQVLLAYPRIAGIEAGYVPRVYVSSFGETPAPGKRRAAKSP